MRRRAILRFEAPEDLVGWRRLLSILMEAFSAAREIDPDVSIRVEPEDQGDDK